MWFRPATILFFVLASRKHLDMTFCLKNTIILLIEAHHQKCNERPRPQLQYVSQHDSNRLGDAAKFLYGGRSISINTFWGSKCLHLDQLCVYIYISIITCSQNRTQLLQMVACTCGRLW
jgi:hypothetical protein